MKHIHTAALACIATTCLSAFGFMTPEKQSAGDEFHATISGYTNIEAAPTGERKSFGFRNTAAEVQRQSKGNQVPTPGPAVLLASVTTEPVIPAPASEASSATTAPTSSGVFSRPVSARFA